MTIEQAMGLAYNFSTRARNEESAKRGADNFRREADEWKERCLRVEDRLNIMTAERDSLLNGDITPSAVVITREGMKIITAGDLAAIQKHQIEAPKQA
jgi:hypothetical protein